MIRYACPRCRAVLQCPDREGGTMHPCPQCGQRLRVPLPKTVLAPRAPGPARHPPEATPARPPPGPPGPAEPPPRPPPAIDPTGPGLEGSPVPQFVRVGLGVVILACLLLAACVAAPALLHVLAPPGSVAEARSEPRTPAEDLVRRWVLNNAPDPRAVTFTRWGPHLTGPELLALAREAGTDSATRLQLRNQDSLSVVRVCYRAPGPSAGKPGSGRGAHDFDQLFLVKGKLVSPLPFPNDAGDDWKGALRKQLIRYVSTIDAEKP